MPTTLEHFDALTEQGLRVIPLRENSKVPMYKGWNVQWDRKRARSRLAMFPDANIGLLLGDVIDVEGDSQEANETLKFIIGDYPHPSYQSVRSIHHLFRTPDPKLRIFKIGEIEFRGHGHQSVLPPSSHYGHHYKWLQEFDELPVMPEALKVFYERNKKCRTLKPGHVKVRCVHCDKTHRLHRTRFELELKAFKLLGLEWQCRQCRSLDLRPACRMIRSGLTDRQVLINGLQQF